MLLSNSKKLAQEKQRMILELVGAHVPLICSKLRIDLPDFELCHQRQESALTDKQG